MATALEGNEMSIAFESRALKGSVPFGSRRISCTLVSGFLGSGKTTLVKHIMHNKGDLRVSLLVNEFSSVDIDSLLIQSQHANVAVGAPPGHGDLAGGCACCVNSSALLTSLQSLLSHSSSDFLLLETSGLSDPSPIASLLLSLGIHLDRIVAVMDADSITTVMREPVARRQLAAADVILLNKCDLLSLSALSDAEDQLLDFLTRPHTPIHPYTHTHTAADSHPSSPPSSLPPPPIVRTRYCQVPIELILETTPLPPPSPLTSATGDLPGGFLSHEARLESRVPAAASLPSVPRASVKGALRVKQLAEREGEGVHEAHRSAGDSAVSSVVFASLSPLPSLPFQQFVALHMHLAEQKQHSSLFPSLLRAKGFLVFQEMPHLRFILQLSGRGRVTCMAADHWESPPECRVVFIGRSKADLAAIVEALGCMSVRGGRSEGRMSAPEEACQCEGMGRQETGAGQPISSCGIVGGAGMPAVVPVVVPAASSVASLVHGSLIKDGRFEVLPLQLCPPGVSSSQQGQERSSTTALLHFGLKGQPLRGISEARLNSILLRRLHANAKQPMFLFSREQDTPILSCGPLTLAIDEHAQADCLTPAITAAANAAISEATRGMALCRCDIPHMKVL